MTGVRHTRRSLLIGTSLVAAAAVAGAVVGRSWVLARAEATLSQRGCSASTLGWIGPRLRASDLRCTGVRVARADVTLWPTAIALRDVEVDLATLLPTLGPDAPLGGDGAGSQGVAASLLSDTRIEGLTVRMGERVLAEGLHGTLDPLALEGPDLQLTATDGRLSLAHRRALDGPTLRGMVSLEATWDPGSGEVQGVLRGDGLTAEHPLLAPRPLTGLGLAISIEGSLADLEHPDLHGDLSLGGPLAHWQGRLDDQGLPVLDLELPDSPAGLLLAPLEPIVPELRTATVQGTIGLSAHWEPGRVLHLTPRIADLWVQGALEPGLGLEWGAFTYQVRDEEGERVPRRSGDGTPGWTPLGAMSPDLVHAVLAAEDSAYHRHAGYHLPAIQEALDADLEAGEVVRGGSTITQQLAKNLFLDGEQTLARKLRELLLAVELDRTLGKDRVMELYLNVVELGPGLHGVAAASERYFMKKPDRLRPQEAVFLAALLPSPRRAYEQWYLGGRPNRARMAAILDNMVDAGWIGRMEAERYKRAKLTLVPPPK